MQMNPESSERRIVLLPDAFVAEDMSQALGGQRADGTALTYPGFHQDDPDVQNWDSVHDLVQHHLTELRAYDDGSPMTLIGAGLGGWLALEIALRARELVHRLVLVSPYGVKFNPPTEPDFADILLLDTEEILRLGWADASLAHGLRLPGFPSDLADDELERVFVARAMLARIGWTPFLHDPHLKRWLHTIDIPTLVIAGEQDGLVPPANSQQIAATLPNAQLVEIPDAGHYPYLERSADYVAAILGFVRNDEGALSK